MSPPARFRDDGGMELGLEGRTCAVTGSSRGIGLATARMLCAEGAHVLLAARGEDALAAAADECAAAGAARGARVERLVIDATAPDAGERVVTEARERLGGLDVVVANAGTASVRPLGELTDDEWEEQWRLNVMGPLRLMRAAAPAMAGRGWGRIVNVSSSAGKRPSSMNAAYAVSKTAQLALSRAFADEYAARGVLVNSVAPGPVETPLWLADGGLADQTAAARGVTRDEALATARARPSLGRFAHEDEIAAVIVFLCSERASNVSGAAWSVDGGVVQSIV